MTRLLLGSCVVFATSCATAPAPSSDHASAQDVAPLPAGSGTAEANAAPGPMAEDAPMSIEAPADVDAPPPGAEISASGLASRVLRAGTGTDHPAATSRVTVHYTGWTTDGKRFDSSVARNSPATFPLDAVIAGWTQGVQLMVVGERRRFWIPGALAYDNSSRADAPRGTLVFDIELISFE